jgi:predicted transcriptional regulator
MQRYLLAKGAGDSLRLGAVRNDIVGEKMSVGPDSEGHSGEELLRLGAGIVAAYVSRNVVAVEAVPDIIRSVHQTLEGITRGAPTALEERPKPAVPLGKSVQHDFIVCLEDGKRLKMLKRYLRSRYNMSPDEYRRRWGLAPDYPMVAPAYAARRSDFAKKIGLGRGVRRRK